MRRSGNWTPSSSMGRSWVWAHSCTSSSVREGDERRAAVAFDGRHAANETRTPQSLEVTMPKISRSSAVIPQIARRHHAKRPDRGQRARFGAAEFVLVLVHVDAFAIMPTR